MKLKFSVFYKGYHEIIYINVLNTWIYMHSEGKKNEIPCSLCLLSSLSANLSEVNMYEPLLKGLDTLQ